MINDLSNIQFDVLDVAEMSDDCIIALIAEKRHIPIEEARVILYSSSSFEKLMTELPTLFADAISTSTKKSTV